MTSAGKHWELSKETKLKISLAHRGKPLSEEHKDSISKTLKGNKNAVGNKSRLGRPHSQETRLKLSKANKGNKSRLGHKHSEETKKRISHSNKISMNTLEMKGLISKNMEGNNNGKSGEEHWKWNGGISSLRQIIMASPEYKEWRKQVFGRDNYICQDCGIDKCSTLEAHHIKSFSEYPELRFDIDNGTTLCKKCHSQTESYLNRNKVALAIQYMRLK